MSHPSGECVQAFDNIGHLLDESVWFPSYVFRGRWSQFFFFDSDWMFDPAFVERVQTLLQIEGGRCACIVNVDRTVRTDDRLFFIDRHTLPAAYRELLFGTTASEGWFTDIGRFGGCSDGNEWCLYAERASEIAVMGVRSAAQAERFRPVLSQLHAAPLAGALADPPSYGFEVLSPQWRNELLKHYG